jgi:hypothetical protein
MGRRIVAYFAAHTGVTILTIFVLAFLVRFALLIQYRHDIVYIGEAPRIAYALISKGQFADPYAIPTGPTAHTTPFFPLVLAGIYKIFGTGYTGQFARCLFVIFGYSVLYSLYPTFASAFGFPFEAGLFAGFFAALVPVKRSFEVFRGWEEPWAAMALAFVLFLTLKRYNAPRRESKSALWVGVCWGLALYMSFSLFSILIGLLVVDVLSHRSLPVLRDACITLIATLAVITPWTLRNYEQLHGWTLMRSNFGLELRVSNHEHAYPSAELNSAEPAEQSLHPSRNIREAMLVRDMGELNYGHWASHIGFTWIFDHPRDFAWLSMQRFFYFWFGPPQHPFELLVTSSYTILGFAGLGSVRKRVGEIQFRMWCTVLLVYPVLYYFFQFVQRYRVVTEWMIWLSAALFLSVILKRFAPEKAAIPVRAG